MATGEATPQEEAPVQGRSGLTPEQEAQMSAEAMGQAEEEVKE